MLEALKHNGTMGGHHSFATKSVFPVTPINISHPPSKHDREAFGNNGNVYDADDDHYGEDDGDANGEDDGDNDDGDVSQNPGNLDLNGGNTQDNGDYEEVAIA